MTEISKASDTDFRKKWDKEEYVEKAKKKDQEERERMQENEERKKPRKSRKGNLPKPTELMKQREAPLELDKNLNKVMVVQNLGGKGPGQPGFYCATCSRTYKDTIGYLDHINSRAHLRALGQSTNIERSTLAQVQARIALLRQRTKEASSAKAYDFEQRLAEIKRNEQATREKKKAETKALKQKARLELVQDLSAQDSDMMNMMGFAGFGSTKK